MTYTISKKLKKEFFHEKIYKKKTYNVEGYIYLKKAFLFSVLLWLHIYLEDICQLF